MGSFTTSTETEIRAILARACALQDLLILATPHMRFESNLLAVDADSLHARLTVGAEESMFGLRSPELRLQFPDGTRFLEGKTKLLGFGALADKRTLRLEIPKELRDGNHRTAFRISRVPRVTVTFSTPKYELRSAYLSNLSTNGACLVVSLGPADPRLKAGDAIAVSIPLLEELHIDSPATVRWAQGRAVGLEFRPALKGQVLQPLSRWTFKMREEEELRGTASAQPSSQSAEILLLVSPSEEVEQLIRELLTELPGLVRIPPGVAALKEQLALGVALVCFHVQSLGLDDKKRLKALVELVGNRAPILLLSTLADKAPLFDLGNELKAAGVYDLGTKPGPFFQRLVQGILRRHAGESRPS